MSPTEITDDRLYLVCPCVSRQLIAIRDRWKWKPIPWLSDRSVSWFIAHSVCLDAVSR